MSEETCDLTCNTCGIEFSFSKKVEKLWRDSHKTFYCPNGHSLVWNAESSEQKEMKQLKKDIAKLTDDLAAMTTKATESEKKVVELTAELEIWRPSSKEP